MKTDSLSAAAFSTLLRSALAEIKSSRQRHFLESKLIAPYQIKLRWEYGNDEAYPAWVFAEMGEREVVCEYCRGGHGARGFPWGINFKSSSHFGQDSGWYATITDLIADWGVEP